MATAITDVLTVHDTVGYFIAVADRSVKHMHHMGFDWLLSTTEELHLAESFGGCDGRGSLLQAEAVGLLSFFVLHRTNGETQNTYNINTKSVSDNLELINRSRVRSLKQRNQTHKTKRQLKRIR